MEDRRKNLNYNPVACEVIDHIEIIATRGEKVSVILGSATEQYMFKTKIVTWFTKNSVEYAEFEGGYKVRLDRLVSIDTFSANDTSCIV